MTSRDKILAKVRAGVAAGVPDGARPAAARRAIVDARLGQPPRHPRPERASGKSEAERVAILEHWSRRLAGGHVVQVASGDGVPAAVAAYLEQHAQPATIRIGADPRLTPLPWGKVPGLTVRRGAADPADTAAVVHALAAVAESGTAIVASGEDNPVTLNFLPETSIVVVAKADVVGTLEDAFEHLAARSGAAMPRTLNMISGPSRSADIGGIPVLGAHGPRRICLVVVG